MPNNTDISTLLLNVQIGKVGITFVETAVANVFLSKNPDTIRKVESEKAVRVFGNTNMLPIQEPDFLQLFNTAQENLVLNGVVDGVLEKYNAAGDFYPTALPYGLPG